MRIYVIAAAWMLLAPHQPPDSADVRVSGGELDRAIDTAACDAALVEEAVFAAANKARAARNLNPLLPHPVLSRSARKTSLEQARNRTLSHTSRDPERRHLQDRLRKEGIRLINVTVGENLGVDYILRIADRPFYMDSTRVPPAPVNAETLNPIAPFTYRQFGETMVDHWLNSPTHRENLLNPRFEWMGVGAVSGLYQDFDAVYVTQHFLGRIHATEKRPAR